MKAKSPSFLIFFIFLSSYTNSFSQEIKDTLLYITTSFDSKNNAFDLNTTYTYLKKSLDRNIEKNNKINAAYISYFISRMEYNMGFYSESEQTATKGLQLIEESPKTNYTKIYKKSIFTQLETLYNTRKDLKKALELNDSVLKLATKSSDSISIFNNRSIIYRNHKKYLEALKEISKSYEIVIRTKNQKKEALILGNLGHIKNLVNSKDGLEEIEKALKLRSELKDTSRILSSYNHLSEYYQNNNNLEKAKEYAWKAKKLAEQNNSKKLLYNALNTLVDLNETSVFKEYKKLNDSIQEAKQNDLNKFALVKYNFGKKEKEIQENKLVIEKQNKRTLLLIFVSVIVILISIAGYWFTKIRNKKKALEAKNKHEKEIHKKEIFFSKKIHDRDIMYSKRVHDVVANDLFQAMEKMKSDEEDALTFLSKVYENARDISREIEPVKIRQDFGQQLKDLTLNYKNPKVNIITSGLQNCTFSKLDKKKKQAVYKIVQELLINMKKHSEAKMVVLKFKESEEELEINYKDNGVGFDLKTKKIRPNVETRIFSINGCVNFESENNKGFKAEIKIKYV
ncbi:hypothetical protein [Aureivirga sp. CE67]|uniref:ATP-binding protein n=1 Tax=Aureivirga sp. CE67 TaxID=1788983 RepID=UPI0018C91D8B|nr:hypothetical protein [Aureivirga sp. CE67]